MKIIFEMFINAGLVIVVSVALISMMSLVKRVCNSYLSKKAVAE